MGSRPFSYALEPLIQCHVLSLSDLRRIIFEEVCKFVPAPLIALKRIDGKLYVGHLKYIPHSAVDGAPPFDVKTVHALFFFGGSPSL